MKFFFGIITSGSVGAGCRYFDIPVGSPADILGAFRVFAMTAGYAWTSQILNAPGRLATTSHICGGPGGKAMSAEEFLLAAKAKSTRELRPSGDADRE